MAPPDTSAIALATSLIEALVSSAMADKFDAVSKTVLEDWLTLLIKDDMFSTIPLKFSPKFLNSSLDFILTLTLKSPSLTLLKAVNNLLIFFEIELLNIKDTAIAIIAITPEVSIIIFRIFCVSFNSSFSSKDATIFQPVN